MKNKRFTIISPCVNCDIGGGCCGCPTHIEWDKWQKSLSNEEWNKEVIKEMDKEISIIKNKFMKLLR